MYELMKPLVMWPDQEQLHKTMPMEFRKKISVNALLLSIALRSLWRGLRV